MESSSSLLNIVGHGTTSTNKRQRSDSADAPGRIVGWIWMSQLDQFQREYFHLPLQTFSKSIFGLPILMTAFGATCTGEGLVSAFGLLCWTISVQACVDGIWLVPIVEVLNGLIKWQFGRPRPGWNDPNVDIRSTSHEYSFPSSHAMLSWSLATFMALYWQDNVGGEDYTPVYALYLAAFCVSISRVFDGAHYPHDILVGGFMGRHIGSFHYTTALPYVQSKVAAGLSTHATILYGNVIAGIMLLLTFICYNIALNRWGAPPKKWCLLAKVKKNQLQPHFVPLFDYVGMCGVFAGLSVAEPIFDSARPGLLIPSSLVVSCLRLFIGLGVLVSAWFAVRAVEKTMATSTWMRLALRFFRYAQVPPIILLVVPPCFEMCGI